MKITKEVRIGILVTAALLIFFAGFYFLKGSNIFSGENEYYTYFENVEGLQPSASIQVKGVNVGRVSEIDLNGGGKVKVTLSVRKSMELPEGSEAVLTSSDLLGGKIIELKLGGGKVLDDEAVLPGSIEGGMLDNLNSDLTPLISDVRHTVSVLDSVMVSIHNALDEETRRNISDAIASLEVASANFANISTRLNARTGEIEAVIHNANSFTKNLADNNRNVTEMLTNANEVSNQLANGKLQETLTDLQGAVANLNGVLNKVENNEGSLGLLVNDKGLYNNLSTSLTTLDSLMADIQEHPSRYINITVFGGKNKD